MNWSDKAQAVLGWESRQVDGERITALQYCILVELYHAEQRDDPWQGLSAVHSRVIKNMTLRDWIVPSKSKRDGSVSYRITYRGKNTLNKFRSSERRQCRNDGLCPHCGKRPRHISPNGKNLDYCKICKPKILREWRQKKAKQSA